MADESCGITSPYSLLLRRQTNDANLNRFLNLLQSSFRQTFSTDAFLASLGSSLGISALIFLAWCLVRPYHSVVYAPKLRHADSKHAPPPVGKGYFSWLAPLVKCHEDDLINMGMGLDAVIFLRFMRLCRTLFFCLGILGCIIMIPVNVTCNKKHIQNANQDWQPNRGWFALMSPMYTWGECMWAHVVIAWVFDAIILYFLWTNYREVVRLRKDYHKSPEYTRSLHSRTLMVWIYFPYL